MDKEEDKITQEGSMRLLIAYLPVDGHFSVRLEFLGAPFPHRGDSLRGNEIHVENRADGRGREAVLRHRDPAIPETFHHDHQCVLFVLSVSSLAEEWPGGY